MRRGDNLRQADILDAIEKVERWTARDADDDLYRAAVAHELGVIGEVASHLSRDFTARHPSVPWPKVVGLRNVLVHQYWDTAWTVLERIVNDDLPALKSALGAPAEHAAVDIEELVSAAVERVPFGGPARAPASAGSEPDALARCGAWMPIARARCVLAPGHFPATHHRSR